MLAGLLAFVLYACTCAPSLGPGHDSGELTAAVYSLGVAHPPGYPLYVRLGHLWCSLPWPGDYAFRLNLFSAAGVAAASGCVTWLVARSTRNVTAGVVAGAGFACLRSVWRQAVLAEVFGLHLALLAITLVLAWLTMQRIRSQQSYGRHLWMVYAALGACLAHHHTFVLALPGLLWLARGRWRQVLLTPAWLAMLLLAGCSYADMLLRARAGPALNWGGLHDGADLLGHFLRRAYGTFQLSTRVAPLESGLAHTAGYGLFTGVQQAPWPWIALAVWGACIGWRKQRDLWGVGLAWSLLLGAFFALIGRQGTEGFHLDMLERFYASSYLGIALLAGIGAADCLERAAARWAGVMAAAAVLVWVAVSNLAACRLDERELTLSYTRQLLDSCPRGALVMVSGDLPVGSLDYTRVVLGWRPDVDVVCPGLLGARWYRAQLSPRVQAWLPPAETKEDERLAWLARRAVESGCPVLTNQKYAWPGRWVARAVAWEYAGSGAGRSDLVRLLADTSTLGAGLGEEARFWPRFLVSTRIAGLRQGAAQVYDTAPQLAWAAMNRAIELGGRRPLDFVNRALLEMRLGRWQAAARSLDTALTLDANLKLASSLREEVQLHLAWQELGRAAGDALQDQ